MPETQTTNTQTQNKLNNFNEGLKLSAGVFDSTLDLMNETSSTLEEKQSSANKKESDGITFSSNVFGNNNTEKTGSKSGFSTGLNSNSKASSKTNDGITFPSSVFGNNGTEKTNSKADSTTDSTKETKTNDSKVTKNRIKTLKNEIKELEKNKEPGYASKIIEKQNELYRLQA